MIDRDFFRLQTPHFLIEGRSRAGHETWFRVRELGLGLDVGRGPDQLVGTANLFISHAHLDHAAGIAFWGAQRRLQQLAGGRVFVPEEAADDFRDLLRLQERLTGASFDIEITGAGPGEEIVFGRGRTARAWQATHRVAARAWEFLESRHHLRPEFAGLAPADIARLRHEGTVVDEEHRASALLYTGDTDRQFLEQCDAAFRAEVLMIECSFVEDGHQERASKYRHIHIDDIAAFAGRFENQMIVLVHFSRRYAPDQIRDEVRRRLPAVLHDRIRLALPEPWQQL